jgi:hypothetical protein
MITINNTHHHYYKIKGIGKKLKRIFSLLNKIQMTEQEVLDRLDAADAKAEKNKQETIAVVAELKAAIEAQGTVSPAVTAALDKLDATLQSTDDLVADATT